MSYGDKPNYKLWIIWGVIGFFFFSGLIGGCMIGYPKYNVWEQGLAGQAELKRAEQNRQISINEAKALKESASFKADAEVIRAHGVAKANAIIGESLKDNEAYLRYLYIDMLRDTGGQGRETIYIPTEANMPIMEANRLNK
jgi:regulator of protease activity HflC (stomatin/prohibitin superfamily)